MEAIMERRKPLKINKEFKNLIRPLLRQEYLQLEENILKDGCREAIITWKGFIVDGHNRYEICTRHNIPYEVREMDFESKEDAIAWICANQLGRRNISDETRKFLIGMQYETEKVISSRKNPTGHNQYTSDRNYDESISDEDYFASPNPNFSGIRTARKIGEENNVSAGTVQKYAVYTRSLEQIGSKVPELVPKILSGRYKISHKNIIDLANMPEDELREVNRRMNRSHKAYFKYSSSRKAIGSAAAEEQPVTPSIKNMPEFDPDAEVTELTLTIPSWVSSINRTQSHANLNIVSDTARNKLIKVLCSLIEKAEDLLASIKEAE